MAKDIKTKFKEKKEHLKIWWDQTGKPWVLVTTIFAIPSVITGIACYAEGRKNGKVTKEKLNEYLVKETVPGLFISDDNKSARVDLWSSDGLVGCWDYDLTKPITNDEGA